MKFMVAITIMVVTLSQGECFRFPSHFWLTSRPSRQIFIPIQPAPKIVPKMPRPTKQILIPKTGRLYLLVNYKDCKEIFCS